MWQRRGLALALVGVAAVWGGTFVTVKEAVERDPSDLSDVAAPVFQFLAMRYVLAAVIVSAVAWPQLRRLGRRGAFAGTAAGMALFAGYTAQTIGLQHTTASNAGFVTGLFVVLAPLLSAILLRRRPGVGPSMAVGLATVGLALLSLTDGLSIRPGDAIVLGAAFSFALHIVILGRYSPEHSPAALTAVQMWVAGVLATGAMLVGEDPVSPAPSDIWQGVLITGILASAAGFFIQTPAQRYVSPTRTALILIMEPVFAGVFGIWLLGEHLSTRGWIGAGLILAAMIASELTPQRSDEG